MPSPRPVFCWGEAFLSVKEMLKDPRATVTPRQFRYNRYVLRLPVEAAATRVKEKSLREIGYSSYYQFKQEQNDRCVSPYPPKVELWGIKGLRKICADPRCVVSYAVAHARIRRGWTPIAAVTTPARGYNKSE